MWQKWWQQSSLCRHTCVKCGDRVNMVGHHCSIDYLVIATSWNDNVGMSFCRRYEKVEWGFDVFSVLLDDALQISTTLRDVASQASTQSEMSNLKCRIWNVEFEMSNLKCRIWICWIRNVEFEMSNLTCWIWKCRIGLSKFKRCKLSVVKWNNGNNMLVEP